MKIHRWTGIALAVGMLIPLAGSPKTARADELSRSDKLKVLYSNQFAFDRQGAPLITVRVAEGLTHAVLESKAPLRVFPDGEDGSKVVGGRRWKISVRSGKPAKQEHFVVLARKPVAALSELRKEMTRWQRRGGRCRLVETGTIFGLKGKVFDNRSYVLVDGPYSSAAKARHKAETYKRRHGLAKVATMSQLKSRPAGRFEALDQDNGTRILARDAIWFAPSPGSKIAVQGGSYWGQIYVTVDRDGKLAVVNAAPAGQLLAGLVPAEIFPSAPRDALRAQAVAARGELLAKIGTRHLVDPYLLCSTQHCQVYRGAGHEHPRTTAAVKATKGKVLVKTDGRLVDTVYSASCGGHTENNDNTWPVEADLNLRGHLDSAVDDPSVRAFKSGISERNLEAWLTQRPRAWCDHPRYNRDKFRWTKRLSVAEANRMVQGLGVGELRHIRVLSRGVSGRATLVELAGTAGRRAIRGELRIRRLFGNLRSSMFLVKELTSANGRPTAFVFQGGGWGHGVGMCQTGAIGMADAGKSYQRILQHYYPGSKLESLF
jgi:SpoIID/LytB domain protein